MSDSVTGDMKISRAVVCESPDQIIRGMLVTLSDGIDSVKMSIVGSSRTSETECSKFEIADDDFLRYFRIGHNETGVYGLEFQTNNGKTELFGISVNSPLLMLTTTSIDLNKDEEPNRQIMGFKGSYFDDRLFSIGAIKMKLDCVEGEEDSLELTNEAVTSVGTMKKGLIGLAIAFVSIIMFAMCLRCV